MRKHASLLAMSLLFFALAFAQTRTVTGQVKDNKGAAVPFASISIKGTNTGVSADDNGNFKIDVSGGQTLIISSSNFAPKEIKVGTSSTLSITLEPQGEMQEVIVTALGIQRNKNLLPYAAQQVSGDNLTKTRSSNFVSQLSGQVSGIQITQTNGIGGSTNAIIRGYKSLTGTNQALFVVDGTPVDNSNTNTANQKTGRGGYDYGNAAADVNPDDIESISVLKGAAASALYGSRASNGVILITTKKGKKRKGIGVTINSGVTLNTVDKKTLPTYQKQYGAGYGPAIGYGSPDGNFFYFDVNGDGTPDLVTPTTEDASWGAKFDPSLMVYQWDAFDATSANYGKATPWVAAAHDPTDFFDKPVSLNNSVSIEGGDDKATFSLRYTRENEKGIMPNSAVNKDILDFSGAYNISSKLKAMASVSYSNVSGLGRESTGYGGGAPNVMSTFRQWWEVNNDILAQKDAYFRTKKNTTWNWSDPTTTAGLVPIYWDNPYWDRYENYETDNRKRTFGNIGLNYKVTSWLNILGRVSLDTYNEFQEERSAVGSLPFFLRSTPAGGDPSPSGYSRFNRSFTEYNYDLLINFDKDITKDLNLKVLAGSNIRQTNISSILAGTNGGLIVPKLYSLSNSQNPILTPAESLTKVEVDGVFGGATLTWKEMIILDGTVRRDKSSTLPSNNNSYTYPSVSGGFIFSKLMPTVKWLNYGKIRANYAEVGASAPALSISNTYIVPAAFGSSPLAQVPGTSNNPNLVPEKTKSYEVGLEMSMLNNRIGLDLSYYYAKTVNQILPVAVSNATGYDYKFVNAGDMSNQGVEVSLNLTPIKTKDFSWDVRVNWSKNTNKVISLFSDSAVLELGSFQGGVTINAVPGKPFGEIRGDDFVYYNKSNQQIVKSNGYYQKTTTTNNAIGNASPDWIGGITNTFRYKNLSLSFLIDVRKGGDIFSLDMYYGLATGLYPETAGNNDLGNPVRNSIANGGGIINPGVLSDGTPNTKRVDIGGFFGAYGYYRKPAAAFIYDASFVKLRSLSIDYSIPQSFVNKIHFISLQGIDVSLFGRNLWIIHKNLPYSDPEESYSSGNIQGYQGNALPTTRSFGFNVKFKF
jgi:TonB-linked SusC/RagA family outer membrane protein